MTEVEDIARAVQLLRAGELVAFPTETVYGLGADAQNPAAVAKIFAAKGRPADHPLIVHLPDIEHLEQWASRIPREAIALARAFWPGPLTLILPRSDIVPDAVTGGQSTVGLRVPAHPLALRLLRAFGSGIAAPSANRFGRVSPTTAQHVRDELGNAVSLILDGGSCDVGIESTIVDLSADSPRILRPGMIGAAEIEKVIGRSLQQSDSAADKPRASGMLEAHYAPATPLQLVGMDELFGVLSECRERGERVGVLGCQAGAIADAAVVFIAGGIDAQAYAHDLYANLHALDKIGLSRILVEVPPAQAPWLAIRDRLRKSAAGAGA